MCDCLSPPPPRGTWRGPQLRHGPWLGIELATPWLAGQHSIHWATPPRASLCIILEALEHISLLAPCLGISLLRCLQEPQEPLSPIISYNLPKRPSLSTPTNWIPTPTPFNSLFLCPSAYLLPKHSHYLGNVYLFVRMLSVSHTRLYFTRTGNFLSALNSLGLGSRQTAIERLLNQWIDKELKMNIWLKRVKLLARTMNSVILPASPMGIFMKFNYMYFSSSKCIINNRLIPPWNRC